jgi:putative transcriptional regulator
LWSIEGDYNATCAAQLFLMQKVNLTQHFLIAMPNMVDPNFAKSLTFICEHNDQGALGVVVNRPTEMNLHALLEQVSISPDSDEFKSVAVHFGGPVQVDRGFVLHTPVGTWQSTLAVGPEIGLTTSKDILQAVARGEGPSQMLVTLGYAGWAPGQLEHELAQNAWLTVQAKREVIFDLPAEERLPAAMSLLGIDYAKLSDTAGHA